MLWAGALVAAPVSAASQLSAAVYAAGSVVCHQRADRSFQLGNAQLPVCARCTGLYAGAIAGVFGWAVIAGLRARPTQRAERLTGWPRLRGALVVIATPTLITVVTASAGIWDPANAVRALLAVPLGAVITGVVVAVAAGDLR